MDFLLQKVSYLQGLAEGLGVDESSKEGKLLVKIIDTLEEFADVLGDCCDDEECGCYCGPAEEEEVQE